MKNPVLVIGILVFVSLLVAVSFLEPINKETIVNTASVDTPATRQIVLELADNGEICKVFGCPLQAMVASTDIINNAVAWFCPVCKDKYTDNGKLVTLDDSKME